MSQVEVLSVAAEEPARPAQPNATWAIACAAGVLLAHVPLLVLHFWKLYEKLDEYGHAFLVPLAAYVLAKERLPGLGKLQPGSTSILAILLGFALAVETFAVAVFSPWTGALGFLFCLLACTYGVGGRPLVLRLFPVWLFCWLILPLPFNLDQQLVTSLQTLTARWSSRMLDTLGVMHVLAGNTVELPGRKLEVEEACSGVHSLFACVSVTLFYVMWVRLPLIRGTLVLLSSVPWVMMANALRVVGVACLEKKGIPASEGLLHTLLGVGVFVFTLTMVLSTDRLILFLLPPRFDRFKMAPRIAQHDEPGPTFLPSWSDTWLGSRASFPAALLYGVLAGGQIFMLALPPPKAPPPVAPATFSRLDANALPEKWGAWKRIAFDTKSRNNIEAEYSRYWTYDSGFGRVYASVDYPFRDWHDLIVCYRVTGWSAAQPTLYTADEQAGTLPYVEVDLTQAPVSFGYLLFYLFDEHGQPMDQRPKGVLYSLRDRILSVRKNWTSAGRKLAQGRQGQDCFQVQLFVEGYTPISEADRRQAQEFFRMLCQEMRGKWLAQAGP